MMMFLRRSIVLPEAYSLSSRVLWAVHYETGTAGNSLLDSRNGIKSPHDEGGLLLSSFFSGTSEQSKGYKIDVVDDETWQVSTGLASVWKDKTTPSLAAKACHNEGVNYAPGNLEGLDFDQIEDMRVCGKLFYKLDKDSKEFEECSFDFHSKKSSARNKDPRESKVKKPSNSTLPSRLENVAERKIETRGRKVEDTTKKSTFPTDERLNKFVETEKMEHSSIEKRQRTLTFNQLTAPYHEPFCLDIYISKASVRACIIHRATSKVVSVAHSISKDLKFDLSSTKNAAACEAVGKVLAQRALADDIHNLVYTPRRDEKLEGKLNIVLQSVINNGISVKVKIKQKKARKHSFQVASKNC